MSKHRLSRIQSAERKVNYLASFTPAPTEQEKAEKLKKLRAQEKGFWRSVQQFVEQPQYS